MTAVDARALVLLFSMMIIVGQIRLAGGIALLARAVSTRIECPPLLVAAIVFSAGVLSALFVNDTVRVAFTPVVLGIAAARAFPPLPLLLALATGANIGSAATLTGNPQNMLIGTVSRIPFAAFLRALGPVALALLVVDALLVWLLFRRAFHGKAHPARLLRLRIHRDLLARSLAGRRRARRLRSRAVRVAASARRHDGGRPERDAATISNAVSNVPAVMLFTKIVPQLPDPARAWLVLGMASTLAGNLTILGSIANLIVVEGARQRGVVVTFRDDARLGVPLSFVTIAIGVWHLSRFTP